MKKVLIGTTNPSKIEKFKELLSGYDVRIYTLDDLKIMDEPEEQGHSPEENAVLKAQFYGRYFETVVCNDSGLYFDELDLNDERQPGVNIRRPGGCERLDDEDMIQFYSGLIHSLGGKVLSYYLDGYAVYDNGKIYSYMETGEEARGKSFYMVERSSERRHAGWPLDSLSLDKDTLEYFVEENTDKYREEDEKEALKYEKECVDFLIEALNLDRF